MKWDKGISMYMGMKRKRTKERRWKERTNEGKNERTNEGGKNERTNEKINDNERTKDIKKGRKSHLAHTHTHMYAYIPDHNSSRSSNSFLH